MSCCSASTLTPLAQYARSMRTTQLDDDDNFDVIPKNFPMYTVPLGTLLDMTQIEPHEDLKARAALVEFQRNMGRAAFVSHQWVTTDHPDPECKQMRILQDALKGMMYGKLHRIPLDFLSEVMDSHAKALPASALLSEPLFFWYDYFSCPQKERLSQIESDERYDRSNLSKAISSIPAYVDKCSFFFALVPAMETPNRDFINMRSWQARGWCRLERTCREFSLGDTSWIIVRSPTDLEIAAGKNWAARVGSGPVGEGSFTVASDRLQLRPVLMAVIRRKILSLLKAQDWASYRSVLNQQAMLLRGLDSVECFVPVELFSPSVVSEFLHQNGFRSVGETDRASWSPIHYAALNGDPLLIQELLTLRADPNKSTKKGHPDLGFESGITALCVCCFWKNNEAAQLLISARAKVTCGAMAAQPLLCAAMGNNVEGIKILCSAGCSPLQRNAFGVSALQVANDAGALEAIDELFGQGIGGLNPTEAFVASGGASAETVHRLVEMGADINDQTFYWKLIKSSALTRTLRMVMILQHLCGKVTQASKIYYHSIGTTPLMMALLQGNHEAAAALIAAGAQLNLRNSRGWTAADFAREMSVPEFLQEAFEGRVDACVRVSLLARGWVEKQL